MQQVERPLKHGRGRADAVVPVDLAEHDVAGEDHQFGGRLALVGDGQPVAGLVQAQAAQQPLLVEVPPVGHAGVQAVAEEIVHLVDVDRAGEHAGEDLAGGVAGLLAQQGDHVARIDVPIVPQHVGDLALQQEAVGEQLVARHARQPDVFDRMAERPVAQVVQQRGGDEHLGVFRPNGPRESLVVRQLLQVQQGQAVHAQAVLEARVDRRRIDQRHQAQLADPGQPAEVGRVDQLPHARRQRHVDLGRNAHQRRGGCPGRRLRECRESRSRCPFGGSSAARFECGKVDDGVERLSLRLTCLQKRLEIQRPKRPGRRGTGADAQVQHEHGRLENHRLDRVVALVHRVQQPGDVADAKLLDVCGSFPASHSGGTSCSARPSGQAGSGSCNRPARRRARGRRCSSW